MVDETVKKCDWCSKPFVQNEDDRRSDCCSSECERKYNSYMANDRAESPSERYANDLKQEMYW